MRATHDNNKLHKVALAIEIAEELCREFWLPATPVFIKAEGDTIVVLVKEN